MLEIMKQLLYGNHDNLSITMCFFANYQTNVVKKLPISNAILDYNF